MPSDNGRLLMMSKGKIVGCGCLIIVIYLVLLVMCRLQSPESYVMGMIPPLVVVLLLVWKEPAWMKGLVAVLLPVVGYYLLYHNDIPGPLEAYNMDKPVSVLSRFHDSWRYYWVMEYLGSGDGGTSGEALATVMGEGKALATVTGGGEALATVCAR